jgi:hypothetical protein
MRFRGFSPGWKSQPGIGVAGIALYAAMVGV